MKKYIVLTTVLTILCTAMFCGCSNEDLLLGSPKNDLSRVTPKPLAKPFYSLVNGIPTDNNDKSIDLSTVAQADRALIDNKYNISYHTYTYAGFSGTQQGTVNTNENGDGWYVSFETELVKPFVCISNNHDPYPRLAYSEPKADNFNNLGSITELALLDCAPIRGVRYLGAKIIDLDADGTNEYILCLGNTSRNQRIVCLIDSDFKIISYLVVISAPPADYLYDYNEKILIIDIDQDNIMEIITEIPQTNGSTYNVYKYDRGSFNHEFINKAFVE